MNYKFASHFIGEFNVMPKCDLLDLKIKMLSCCISETTI